MQYSECIDVVDPRQTAEQPYLRMVSSPILMRSFGWDIIP